MAHHKSAQKEFVPAKENKKEIKCCIEIKH
jgi:hypothetical protein